MAPIQTFCILHPCSRYTCKNCFTALLKLCRNSKSVYIEEKAWLIRAHTKGGSQRIMWDIELNGAIDRSLQQGKHTYKT